MPRSWRAPSACSTGSSAEDAYRSAMAAYCRLGQRREALSQYERCRQALEAELGVAPMPETQSLRQAILEGRLTCEATERPPPAARSGPTPRSCSATRSMPSGRRRWLVVRRRWRSWPSAWQAALRGDCSSPAGKRRGRRRQDAPGQKFGERLRWQGVRVLEGRCYEFERLLPYQPVAEALGTAASARSGSSRRQPAPPGSCAEVGAAGARHRRLGSGLAGRPAPCPTSAARAQERLFEGVARFLAHGWHAQQPLLLILEDLHWATDSTLQLLHYLARDVAAAAVADPRHAAAVRPSRPAHPLATLGRRLRARRDGSAPAAVPLLPAGGRRAGRADVGRRRRTGEAAGTATLRGNRGQPVLPDPNPQARSSSQGSLRIEDEARGAATMQHWGASGSRCPPSVSETISGARRPAERG